MAQSWLEGPEVHDADPWNTKEYGLHGREFGWFEEQLADSDEGLVAADGGEAESTDD